MIQAAVDDAAQSGERVEIPRRNTRTGKDIWILPRAIRLYSGSTVILDNCHLRLADGAFDNIFKNSIARTEEAALVENRQYDICIAGMGNAVLDGGNHNGLVERNAREKGLSTLVNTLIHFHNAQRIVVENLRMVNARYWGMTFHFCSHGRVSNLHFQSCGHCPDPGWHRFAPRMLRFPPGEHHGLHAGRFHCPHLPKRRGHPKSSGHGRFHPQRHHPQHRHQFAVRQRAPAEPLWAQAIQRHHRKRPVQRGNRPCRARRQRLCLAHHAGRAEAAVGRAARLLDDL